MKSGAISIVKCSERDVWRDALNRCAPFDVCHLPEYHCAYETREAEGSALLWVYDCGGDTFCYPFFLSPVNIINGEEVWESGFRDISSVYGYSGPLSSTTDSDFLSRAWSEFDEWSKSQKVIAEFVRFSCFVDNDHLAHPKCDIASNRPIAFSNLPDTSKEYFANLRGKTRNMVHRAERSGLIGRIESLSAGLDAFRELYQRTMQRNQSTTFFDYGDLYYDHLLNLDEEEVFISCIYNEEKLVSGAIALAHGEGSLYHLGANDADFMRNGCGNLCLFKMTSHLIELGVRYLTMGGGRTTTDDDPLYKFKSRNATDSTVYEIGKRVVDQDAYDLVVARWLEFGNSEPGLGRLIFYR